MKVDDDVMVRISMSAWPLAALALLPPPSPSRCIISISPAERKLRWSARKERIDDAQLSLTRTWTRISKHADDDDAMSTDAQDTEHRQQLGALLHAQA